MQSVITRYQIPDGTAGAVAVVACIIMQAVEDVRLYLEAPHFAAVQGGASECSRSTAKSSERERQLNAQLAAAWLDGNDCRKVCELLEACGFPVPLARIKRDLLKLKRKAVSCG